MSVWTTRSLDRDRDYIVVKHSLRGVNININGIKFRDGYAVVEKDSKSYYELKKAKPVAIVEEFPLIHLKDLKFVTRSQDIKTVYGSDVYNKYVKQLEHFLENKKEEDYKNSGKCQCLLDSGRYCKQDKFEFSPSGYCIQHLLKDPKLLEFGIQVPLILYGKQRKKEFRDNVIKTLKKLKSEGKF